MMNSAYRILLSPAMSWLVFGFVVAGLTSPASAAEPQQHRGAVIYKNLCASCHGDRGQGVAEKYDEPLHGNRTVESLAKRIAKTMPEDNVGACVGDDAKAVSEYIYDAFYSPQAQLRLRPPEYDLARLTNAQFRNSVTDLIAMFRSGTDRPDAPRGLKASYTGKNPGASEPDAPEEEDQEKRRERERRERVKFDRVDERIAFSYGTASPDPERMRAEEFRVRWEGAILAPETGAFEFIVRTENGARLWVNDRETPLIDAWVSQGPQVRDEKKSVHLLGGRMYPLALEYFKVKGEKSGSIELRWKPPHGVEEVVPTAQLVPQGTPPKYVVSTSFPPDDRSAGYERGTTISKGWDQATTEAAIETAEYVADRIEGLADAKPGAADRVDKLKAFARRFVEGAFRRPLSPDDVQRYVDAQFATAKSPEQAVKRVVLLTLKSPRFLYPELPNESTPDGYDIATRLALYVWDSIPDKALLRAAAEGKLKTREQVAAEAERMLADPRAKSKLHGFFHHWLELERGEAVAKDPQAFPEFNKSVLADLRTSLNLFLDEVIWSEKSDYRELLYADYLYLNERLGKLYGKDIKGETFQRVSFDPKQRAGVVTHPYLLAAFAYGKQTSPIHRGVFLTRSIVGMTLKPPPDAVAFDDAMFDQHLTMREKVTELTKSASCMGCHATINPLGFSLENYDAIGRWREKERDKVIDAVSDFSTDEGQTIRLTGPRDLVKFAAESGNGHRAFIHQLFHHTVKQEVGVYGPDTLEALRQSFTKSNLHVRKLLAEITTIAASRGLPDAAPKLLNQASAGH